VRVGVKVNVGVIDDVAVSVAVLVKVGVFVCVPNSGVLAEPPLSISETLKPDI
jgi:hypothetical protein